MGGRMVVGSARTARSVPWAGLPGGLWWCLLASAGLAVGGCDLVNEELYQQRKDELTDDDGDGFTEVDGDCNDNDPDVYPDAVEACDGIDNDCDGLADEDAAGPTWYLDGDGDGHGSADNAVQSCARPEGFVDVADDCDDGDASVYPGAAELCDDVDQDCDGEVDEGAEGTRTWYPDADGDGVGTDVDDNLVFDSCRSPGAGWVTEAGDCDDGDASVYPGASERCNGLDDDCDLEVDEEPTVDPPTWYPDGDGDGYGLDAKPLARCVAPEGYTAAGGDCDDGDAAVYPGAVEACDGLDNDCDLAVDEAPTTGDPTWYHDGDGDGYGDDGDTRVSCLPPEAYVLAGGDCDDGDASVHPGAEEVCNDGVDNDCDATAGDPGIGDACHWDAELELMDQLRVEGVYEGDSLGRGLAYGDLDGDGVTELLVGGPYAYDPETDTHPGRVFSFEAPFTANLTWEDADWSMEGEVDVSQFGSKVEAADIDGDGVDDLVNGAWYLDVGALDSAGRAYVTYGPVTSGGPITEVADWTLSGVTDSGKLGKRIHAVGDLDGDGVTDVLVGSQSYVEDYGGSGLFYLLTDAGSGSADIDEVAAAVFTPGEDDAMGRDYTGVDIDADGVGDLLIGAEGRDRAGMTGVGAAYIFFGGDLSGEINSDDYDLWWYGESGGDAAGVRVDRAGDVNDDGADDIIVGAPYHDTGGAVYIVWGGAGVDSGPLADADVTIRGERGLTETNARYIGGLADGLGDIDGDGQDDVLVGEWGNPGSLDRYVFYGPLDSRVSITDLDADVILVSDPDDEGDGMALAPGDITGDGVPDLVLSSYSHTVGFEYWAGVVYIVPGMGL